MNHLAIERLKQALYELRDDEVPAGVLRTDDLRALILTATELTDRGRELEVELATENALNVATQRTLQQAHVAWARELFMQRERGA